MATNLNVIPPNKHVLVCGMTGTGKSYLCENYLRTYKYVVKLDTKNETAERRAEGRSPWEGLEEGKDFTVIHKLEELDDVETDKIIYCPDYDEQNQETFDMFFRWIFERGNTICWIDELMSVTTANTLPRNLGRIATQGRSKNVALWSCTQRPTGIPLIIPSNCHYFFTFTLNQPADRKRLSQVTGQPELLEDPEGYNFWYYKVGDKRTVKAIIKT